MRIKFLYIILGNLFSILNILALTEKTFNVAIVLGILSAFFYIKALTIKFE
jgi:hypothetical protein